MSGREFAVEPDRWALPRRQSVRLSHNRVLPGPLKSLPRRRTPSAWLAGLGLGLAGLSLAAALSLTPWPSAEPAAEPAPEIVTNAAVEAPSTPRVVGAAVLPAPVAPPPAADVPATEPPALRTAAAEPAPPPAAPPVRPRAAAPALDLGQLPVLALDASAFEAPPVAEAPRPAAKAPVRAPAPRLAGQH